MVENMDSVSKATQSCISLRDSFRKANVSYANIVTFSNVVEENVKGDLFKLYHVPYTILGMYIYSYVNIHFLN